MSFRAVVIAFAFLASNCTTHSAAGPPDLAIRGVWVATVNNIDWPSRRDLTAGEQQAELVRIFDRAASLGLNAVFLQIRPAADAIYPSHDAPWTEYLTGTSGQPPDPPYDPLAFAVAEAHRRGLKLHAWFNPFRARHTSAVSAPSPSHIETRRPDLIRPYGTQLWLDPGEADAQLEVITAIADVVKRYDVDGVHVDDYFYPYPEQIDGAEAAFPDDASWSRYRDAGGALTRDDWRRDNINRFVEALYSSVKAIRPGVAVGISPFGIWRPGHPDQIRGFDAYAKLYADSRLWLQRGWVDYLAPQLYWPIDRREQSFTVLLDWWLAQDSLRRGIVAGMSVNRVASGRPNSIPAGEIARQIEAVRRAGARGFILFSARALMEDRGGVNGSITDALHRN
jgi:uncharacterized lipoprotein YddW (UPF0748 family)